MLINTGNISRKVLSKVLRSFVKNFERLQKQTYIPKICSIFNLTEECTFDIIQAERTNVPEQIFLCEVCYESTEECIPYDGQRVKII